MDNAFDDLQEQPVCDSIADADDLIAQYEEWKKTDLNDASAKYAELDALVNEMSELGSTENSYTTLTPTVSATYTQQYDYTFIHACSLCTRSGASY